MYTINKGVECIIILNLSEQEMNLRKGILITRAQVMEDKNIVNINKIEATVQQNFEGKCVVGDVFNSGYKIKLEELLF